MLRFVNYNIVFQEVPGEVTLAVNLSNCPNRCRGCHSPYLQQDIGAILDVEVLAGLLEKYGDAITCVCFMGGDASPCEVEQFARFVRSASEGRIKTGWYSGKEAFPDCCSLRNFDYLKLGPYLEQSGGLGCATTNQRFYHIVDGERIDMTGSFLKKER